MKTMIDNPRISRFDRWAVLGGVAVLQIVLLVAVAIPGIPSLVQLPVAVTYLTVVPGLLLSSLFGIDDRPFATKVVYVVGLSFIIVMAVGAAISLLYPLVGIKRPLSPISLTATLFLIVVALSGLVVRRGASLTVAVPIRSLASPVPLALLSLPFVSILGTIYYHLRGSNVVLLAMLTVIALVPLVLVAANHSGESDSFKWYTLTIWTVSLALVYHGESLLPPYLGGVKAGQLTMVEEIWLPNAQGLGGVLPNVILYPTYAILSGVPLAAETVLVNPFLVSLLPVVLFELFRRQTSQLCAFLSCCIFMFSFPFYTLYPVGGRVASPVFFLALIGLALSDRELSPIVRSLLVLAFSSGIVVSHYGTAWVAMFAFFGTIGFFYAVKMWDQFRNTLDASMSNWRRKLHHILNRAPSVPFRCWQQRNVLRTHNISPSLSFFGVYSVLSIAWYLYTSQGTKFIQLPIKIVDAIQGVLYLEFGGSAVNTAARQYGSQIVSVSRLLYILIGFLMIAGIAVTLYRRVIEDITNVNDGFLALGVGFSTILVGSMLPSGKGFAIARVMMIVFTFTLPFVLIGVNSLVSIIEVAVNRLEFGINSIWLTPSTAFAVVLALFLILNSGVVAAVLQQGYSPSTKVGQERLANSEDPIERAKSTPCLKCNIEAHVWVMQHNASEGSVYGDEYVQSQTDFYQGALEPRVPFKPQPPYYDPVSAVNRSSFGNGYILLLERNFDTNGFYEAKYEWSPFGVLQLVLGQSNQIYDSRSARIYASTNNTYY